MPAPPSNLAETDAEAEYRLGMMLSEGGGGDKDNRGGVVSTLCF